MQSSEEDIGNMHYKTDDYRCDKESPFMSFSLPNAKHAFITIFKCHKICREGTCNLYVYINKIDGENNRGMIWNYQETTKNELPEYVKFMAKSRVEYEYLRCANKIDSSGNLFDNTGINLYVPTNGLMCIPERVLPYKPPDVMSFSPQLIIMKSNIGFSEMSIKYDDLFDMTKKFLNFLHNIDEIISPDKADVSIKTNAYNKRFPSI
jgi:hypothetical protein